MNLYTINDLNGRHYVVADKASQLITILASCNDYITKNKEGQLIADENRYLEDFAPMHISLSNNIESFTVYEHGYPQQVKVSTLKEKGYFNTPDILASTKGNGVLQID